MDFHYFLRLDKLLYARAFEDKVLKVVPKLPFVDIQLDLVILVSSDEHFVLTCF